MASDLQPLTAFPENKSAPRIAASASPRLPWTVAGENGALFGRQDGSFEAWTWPVKILSHVRIDAELADYAVPIDVNALATRVEVTPAETTITYSHAAFTIVQHAFAPRGSSPRKLGAAVYYEIHSIRSLSLTFSFTPDMLPAWPAPDFGRPDPEWIGTGESGIYILHTNDPSFSGVVAMPGTKPGILPPYQEHPQVYPLQLKLTFDPKRDSGKIFPLLFGVSDGSNALDQARTLEDQLTGSYVETQNYYASFFDSRTVIETPWHELDEATRWAEIAVDQMQVRSGTEIGMVAGYYESAASARPGYAWFFGRDTLWTTYAINSYGDFALTRRALDFLLRRQRADGKIMHEYSQSAPILDWKSTPYFYASADAVPLLVMAMWDYVRSSGDLNYLKQNWAAVRKAYEFERSHDSDGDGIYENTEGTGWVESWPPGMPHQEIYLAALDQQASDAMSRLAALMQDTSLSSQARNTATKIGETIPAEYLPSGENFYAFNRNANGTLDNTESIYPAVAWWQNTWALPKAQNMLSRWAGAEFSTDWGARDISPRSPFFDPISYHQGTVWPLFTGWVSLAEYRAGHNLSAYAHLMQNVRLTWLQDLGATTELLSGEFYEPLGRSSSHQMWSSAMILSPLLRGLFGIEPDAIRHRIRLQPHLPANWDHAIVRNVRVGDEFVNIAYQRRGSSLDITATTRTPQALCLDTADKSDVCSAAAQTRHELRIPGPLVEIALIDDALDEGDQTHAVKVLDEFCDSHRARFTLSAPGGSRHFVYVRDNTGSAKVEGLERGQDRVSVLFPPGEGYQTKVLEFSW